MTGSSSTIKILCTIRSFPKFKRVLRRFSAIGEVIPPVNNTKEIGEWLQAGPYLWVYCSTNRKETAVPRRICGQTGAGAGVFLTNRAKNIILNRTCSVQVWARNTAKRQPVCGAALCANDTNERSLPWRNQMIPQKAWPGLRGPRACAAWRRWATCLWRR